MRILVAAALCLTLAACGKEEASVTKADTSAGVERSVADIQAARAATQTNSASSQTASEALGGGTTKNGASSTRG